MIVDRGLTGYHGAGLAISPRSEAAALSPSPRGTTAHNRSDDVLPLAGADTPAAMVAPSGKGTSISNALAASDADRRRRVLELQAEGHSQRAMAEILGVSRSTVQRTTKPGRVVAVKRPDVAARNRAMAGDPDIRAKRRKAWTPERREVMRAVMMRNRAGDDFEQKRMAALVTAMRSSHQRQMRREMLLFDLDGYAQMRAAACRACSSITVETTLGPRRLRRYQARRFYQWRLAVGDREALSIVTGKSRPQGFQWTALKG